MGVIYTGFWTDNDSYPADYCLLKECMDALKLNYDFAQLPNKGDWFKNTALKAEVVKDFIQKYKGQKIVQVDVDSIITTNPTSYFDSLDCDVSAVMFAGQTLLSGVTLFQCNDTTLGMVDKWIDMCKTNLGEWEQRKLHRAILQSKVKFLPMNPAYNWMCGLGHKTYPDVTPVIIATRAALKNNVKQ